MGKLTKQLMSGLAGLALAATVAGEAGAFTLDFSNTTGFRASSGTVAGLSNTAPTAGRGGLEFFNAITAPPGPPLGDNTAPPGIFQVVGWGCTPSLSGVIPPATCANGGTIGSTTTPATNPFGNINRSALQSNGLFGQLTDAAWTDVNIINHQNNVISGNVLAAVSIDTIFRLGPDPAPIPVPSTTNVEFTETLNLTSGCTASAGPGAPINPLGSTCDDFFFVDGIDLTPILIPAEVFGPNAILVSFRLDPRDGALVCTGDPGQPAACGAYAGPDILLFTREADINSLALQARLTVIGIPGPMSLVLLGAGLMSGAVVAAVRRKLA